MALKLGMGIVNFIKDALLRHKRDEGSMPRRIVVHPNVLDHMRHEMTASNWMTLMGMPEEDGTQYFCGIELEIDLQASQPKLISTRNEVQYM
jgi:hypothetical protein